MGVCVGSAGVFWGVRGSESGVELLCRALVCECHKEGGGGDVSECEREAGEGGKIGGGVAVAGGNGRVESAVELAWDELDMIMWNCFLVCMFGMH